MILQLLSKQVPQFWETIKFVATNADEVDKEILQPYLNELLYSLLSDKAACFIRLDEKRILKSLLITRVLKDKITGKNYLILQCLYSFQMATEEEWKNDWIFILDYAKNNECSYISFDSRNKRIWEVSELVGFKERRRQYCYSLER